MLRIIRKRNQPIAPSAPVLQEPQLSPPQVEAPGSQTLPESGPQPLPPSEESPVQAPDLAAAAETEVVTIQPEVASDRKESEQDSASGEDTATSAAVATELTDDRPDGKKVICEMSNPGPVANDTGYTFESPKTGTLVRVLHKDDESREDAIARVRKAHGL